MSEEKKETEVLDYITSEVFYDPNGVHIYFDLPEVKWQKLLDIRGWGHLSTTYGEAEAEKLQDKIGNFVAEAINEKIEREKKARAEKEEIWQRHIEGAYALDTYGLIKKEKVYRMPDRFPPTCRAAQVKDVLVHQEIAQEYKDSIANFENYEETDWAVFHLLSSPSGFYYTYNILSDEEFSENYEKIFSVKKQGEQ